MKNILQRFLDIINHYSTVFFELLLFQKRQKELAMEAKNFAHHYDDVIKSIKDSDKKKLNFAAYVIFDSTFGGDGIFRLMLDDKEHWNPRIVIIPDVKRGEGNKRKLYKQTRDYFINLYGKEYVFDGWNPDTEEFFDYLEELDIVYYANPYDDMVNEVHKIQYAVKKNVLPIYISYGYDVGKSTTLGRLRNKELNFVWKCFADTTYSYNDFCEYQTIKGANVVLAGYSKMDRMEQFPACKNERKKILIASHHTVSMKRLPLSNFCDYYNLIISLPNMFPEVDFVFRPHPLLFTTLINEGIWNEKQVEQYLAELRRNGIEYSYGGDYFKIFAECDAIINDCGSFTVEWLYTGKPGCFVYNKKLKKRNLTTLMNMAVAQYRIARNENDIIEFIQDIIRDDYNENIKNASWFQDNIAINYPKVSKFILDEINILKGELV